MSFSSIYTLYLAKVEKKNRTKQELDSVIFWLTGYNKKELQYHLDKESTFEEFFSDASKKNPLRKKITGKVCGVRIQDIEEPIMKEIRYLDKLVDELAKGFSLEKILRKE